MCIQPLCHGILRRTTSLFGTRHMSSSLPRYGHHLQGSPSASPIWYPQTMMRSATWHLVILLPFIIQILSLPDVDEQTTTYEIQDDHDAHCPIQGEPPIPPGQDHDPIRDTNAVTPKAQNVTHSDPHWYCRPHRYIGYFLPKSSRTLVMIFLMMSLLERTTI